MGMAGLAILDRYPVPAVLAKGHWICEVDPMIAKHCGVRLVEHFSTRKIVQKRCPKCHRVFRQRKRQPQSPISTHVRIKHILGEALRHMYTLDKNVKIPKEYKIQVTGCVVDTERRTMEVTYDLELIQ